MQTDTKKRKAKTITEDIISWSKDFIELPNKHLGGVPACPFAKKARLNDKVRIVEINNSHNLLESIIYECNNLKSFDKFKATSFKVKIEDKIIEAKLKEIANQNKQFEDKNENEKAEYYFKKALEISPENIQNIIIKSVSKYFDIKIEKLFLLLFI